LDSSWEPLSAFFQNIWAKAPNVNIKKKRKKTDDDGYLTMLNNK